MENKEKNIPNPELKDEELDAVSGGVILPGQPVIPLPERPDPNNPNAIRKPKQPVEDPKIF